MEIERDQVETHFCLIKRTAKGKTFKERIEIFKTTSGDKRIKNSLKVLQDMVINAENKKYVKNKLNCINCEYARTLYCKGL